MVERGDFFQLIDNVIGACDLHVVCAQFCDPVT